MQYVAKTIGLLDHMGGGNLGDDATQEAVMHNIRRRWPGASIFGFSMNPSDTQARHGISAYPIRRKTWTLGANSATAAESTGFKKRVKTAALRHPVVFGFLRTVYALVFKIPAGIYGELRFLVSSHRVLRSFDLLIISGGGQLTESWGGPWDFPYTIFKWIVLARLARVRPLFLNVGAGPLSQWLSKYFIRKALSLADYVSFRDTKSAELVRRIGFKGETPVFPDAVYSLRLDAPLVARPAGRSVTNVGIAPMPYGLPPLYADKNAATYDSLIQQFATFGSRLLAKQHEINLFCTDIGVDAGAVQDLRSRLIDNSNLVNGDSVRVSVPRSTSELLSVMSCVQYVITCRFHGVVFAHLLNIPVVALTYHPKTLALMENLGLSRYCLSIRTIDADTLTNAFFDLVANAAEIKKQMSKVYSSNRDKLARQFDDLFPQTRLADLGVSR
jgi:polysaccharide pyruvyl transferase WcaK-like protein